MSTAERLLTVAAFVLVMTLAACTSSFEVSGSLVRIQPPASYRAVWDSAQACTGRHGRFEDLEFFVGGSLHNHEESVAGHTEGKRIYIAEGFERHPLVVEHEMIHALGIRHHPVRPFVIPCRATWASYRGGDRELDW